MRHLFLCLFFFTIPFNLAAQWEIKLNPVGLLFNAFNANVEVMINDNFAVESDVFIVPGDFWAVSLNGKYYFSPSYGADGFNAGIFIPVYNDGVGVGFLIGYKWMSAKNVLFEIAGGVARVSGDAGGLPYGKFLLGYRFNTNYD